MSKKITLLAGISLATLALVACSDGGTEPGSQGTPPAQPPANALGNGVMTGTGDLNADDQQPTAGSGNDGMDDVNTMETDQTGNGAMAVPSGVMGVTSDTMAVAGNIPIGTGLNITPEAGFVPGASNGLGIQGSFYTFSDSDDTGDSSIAPLNFTMDVGSAAICVSGTAAVIPPDPADPTTFEFGRVWGAAVGFNLANPGDALGGPGPWAREGVTGFSYTLSGAVIPADMRFTVKFVGETGDQYCASIVGSAGAKTTSFAQVTQACWAAAGAALPASDLIALQWGIVASTAAPIPFDFCIENLTALQ